MELDRRMNQLEQLLVANKMENMGLINIIVFLSSKLEKLTGEQFLVLKDEKGNVIPVPDNVPVPEIVGRPQMVGQPPKQEVPSVKETKNVMQAQDPTQQKKVEGPELNTMAPSNICQPEEVDLGCNCEGECTCDDSCPNKEG
jgi:hypothetical protein